MTALSLKIVGNPKANAGPEPLININNAYFTIPDETYAGVSGVPWYLVITTDEYQTLFKLVVNRVHSVGASRQGTLVFGLGLPRGYRIAGGVSPAQVLFEVKDLFVQSYMTCTDPSKQRYEFTPEASKPDPSLFEALLAKYKLEPVAAPHVTMNPAGQTASIILPAAKIAELTKDVSYPQFAHYNEIVVAENIDPAIPTITVAIPRVPVYTVMVNGMIQERVTDIDKIILAQAGGSAVQFTIRQLLDGAFVPGVDLNSQTETVSVTAASRPEVADAPPANIGRGEMPYRIVINPARTLGSASELTLTVAGKTVRPDADGAYYLTPQMAQQVRVCYGGTDYVVTDCHLSGNEYQVGIKPHKDHTRFLGMRPWMVLVVGAVVGLLLGLVLASVLSGGHEEKNGKEETGDVTKKFDPDEYKNNVGQLHSEDITFDKVLSMCDQYKDYRDECIDVDSLAFARLMAYGPLVKALVEGDLELVYQYACNDESVRECVALIDPIHLSPVIFRFIGDGVAPDMEKSKEYLDKYHGSLTNFQQLFEDSIESSVSSSATSASSQMSSSSDVSKPKP